MFFIYCLVSPIIKNLVNGAGYPQSLPCHNANKVMPSSLGIVPTSGFCSKSSGFCPSLDQWVSEASWKNL